MFFLVFALVLSLVGTGVWVFLNYEHILAQYYVGRLAGLDPPRRGAEVPEDWAYYCRRLVGCGYGCDSSSSAAPPLIIGSVVAGDCPQSRL